MRLGKGPDTGLIELVEARAAATPAHTLLVDEQGRRLTARCSGSQAHLVADRLAGAGIGPGSVVSWVLPTGIDALVVTAALSRLGAVQNPVIPIYREREIGHIVDEIGTDAFVVTPRWRDFDYLELCHDLASARGGRTAVFDIADVVDIRRRRSWPGRTAPRPPRAGRRAVGLLHLGDVGPAQGGSPP